MSNQHISVMPREVIAGLNIKKDGIYADGTLGLGGHSKLIASQLDEKGRLICVDKDLNSLERAKENLKDHLNKCVFINEDFRNMDKVFEKLKIHELDGILLDLGISSFQLNNPERGFSLRMQGPLDMRMDQSNQISAYDLINSLSEKELSQIFKDYGEERWHQRIAKGVVQNRSRKPIETTDELTEIILQSLPYKKAKDRIHPATRTFQALRIAVNRELEALEVALDNGIKALKMGGRFVIISFHSLEDRIVKHRFKKLAKVGTVKLIVKKPLRPSEDEIRNNPRSRSARLRIVERV
ncbi:MAG: 16S rRNA (cytosine(1402)-N(4))-methyltransferase RsmH [Candidatus Omnitrophica bacterium]|nr:16S rRNA (cytosine(1402)-N(4))-methyltransferase RsmH [Candidatus Omnitrophota bacterium]MCB9747794.1 16S rRNA (cytosine(1402)-N(4))-methyltransferase RsmH [Candidatus Omnitrophota bacterium]